MKSADVRKRYLDFFVSKGHAVIPSAPLVPENDPTTLFNSSGMQPLVPYLLGQPHPSGVRLVNSQKSFRAQDIDEVGDNRHITFFEMLGNWSLGDYFKAEQLEWIFTFLTDTLSLDPKRLYVSVFSGEGGVPKDTESVSIWKELFASKGVDAREGDRILAYGAKKNWWSRSGEPDKMPVGEPGGPDSEVFYDFGPESGIHEKSPYAGQPCHPNCDCGRFMEIANSVFMEYKKADDGSLIELLQKNVDFGGGLDRLVAVTEGTPDIFLTDLFLPIIGLIQTRSSRKYGEQEADTRAMRIIADHIRGSVMMAADGVLPANKHQGYIMRRLLRRSLLYGRHLGLGSDASYLGDLVDPVVTIYKDYYPEIGEKRDLIRDAINEESSKFNRSLEKGIRELQKIDVIDGSVAFRVYETFGFPWEMTEEIARSRGQSPDRSQFEAEFRSHQDTSRTAAAGLFKGGLADHSETTTRLHTATHLLHQALRIVLGNHVSQKGSNITGERLRFDFSHPKKLTDEEISKIEALVNEQIGRNLPMMHEVMPYKDAVASGALAFFGERYPEQVKVYSAGDFSKEICGGPHVGHIGELGTFSVKREESASAGVRRIYGVLDGGR